MKHILVTGGNSGIGLALCKRLATEYDCHVYLGSRNADRGSAAIASIVAACPDVASRLVLVQRDASDDLSCAAPAQSLRSRHVSLYGVVNNAEVGLAHCDVGGVDGLLNTNFYGPKRVTEALVDLIDPTEGRVVNVSSGVASMWLREQDVATKALFTNPDVTFSELDANVRANQVAGNLGIGGGYGLSKAGLTTLTMVQAKTYPNLKIVSLSPGFIDTNMTRGFGAKLTPEQGCVSCLKCLFEDVTSGHYYGSDGLRSPLTCTRDPGMPEYQGEAEPDPAMYNR